MGTGLVVAFLLSELLDSEDGSKSVGVYAISFVVGFAIAVGLSVYLRSRRA